VALVEPVKDMGPLGRLKLWNSRIRLGAMRLSVVVPCFNEEGNIARVVAQASDVGRRLASELEIIVVDDGSTDDTARLLVRLQETVPELKIVSHPANRGYGVAVRSGLDRARMDYVFLTDGDGQFDLEELPGAIQLLSEHDVVAGYRTHRQDGWWRRLWGRCWTALVNQVFGLGVRDANCAFKLVPRSLLLSSDLRSQGALISAELLFEAQRAELSVGECAVSHYPRRTGRQSGASIRVIATAFMELVACLPRIASSTPRGFAR
jgi:glycosyltransferase involved in cell wall biosynthesis